MKTLGMLLSAAAMWGCMAAYGQEIEPEVPGDQFSLEGALELFKQSASPEEFERLLNSPDSKVNNLDLNGDGYIDYIRVFDRHDGNVHAFILQAVISDTESQDVAVIELEKLANGKAVLQIVGDEDIYGIETIIEPTREVRTYAGATTSRVVVNVWAWPSVQYIYGPYYAGWFSPWGWYARPVWWHPWRPVVYVHYYNIWRPYHRHYSICHTHRVVYAHRIYHPHRTTSVVVRNRYHTRVEHYRTAYHNGHRDNGRSYSGHNSRSDRTYTQGRQGTTYDSRHNGNGRSSTGNSQRQYRQPTDRQETGTPNRYVREQRPTAGNRSGFSETKKDTPPLSTGRYNRETPVTKPATDNRNGWSGNSSTRQRTTERTAPAQYNRSQPVTRPATVNSNRSSGSPQMQSRPAGRTETGRYNGGNTHQMTKPATVNKGQSSGSSHSQSRSGGKTSAGSHSRGRR